MDGPNAFAVKSMRIFGFFIRGRFFNMTEVILIFFIFVGLGGGFGAGYFLRKKIAQAQANSIEAKAEKLLTEAKAKQQEYILEAKEKSVKIIDDAKREERQLRQDMHNAQQRLERRESMFDQKLIEFQEQQFLGK